MIKNVRQLYSWRMPKACWRHLWSFLPIKGFHTAFLPTCCLHGHLENWREVGWPARHFHFLITYGVCKRRNIVIASLKKKNHFLYVLELKTSKQNFRRTEEQAKVKRMKKDLWKMTINRLCYCCFLCVWNYYLCLSLKIFWVLFNKIS